MANILVIDDDEAMLALIQNVLKKDGHTITCISRITKTLKRKKLLLRIQDEGEGFAKEALLYATNEFYRSDQSRNSKEHFGLGLAIVRQIVTELNGTICLENVKEKGTLVTVSLPLVS